MTKQEDRTKNTRQVGIDFSTETKISLTQFHRTQKKMEKNESSPFGLYFTVTKSVCWGFTFLCAMNCYLIHRHHDRQQYPVKEF